MEVESTEEKDKEDVCAGKPRLNLVKVRAKGNRVCYIFPNLLLLCVATLLTALLSLSI